MGRSKIEERSPGSPTLFCRGPSVEGDGTGTSAEIGSLDSTLSVMTNSRQGGKATGRGGERGSVAMG